MRFVPNVNDNILEGRRLCNVGDLDSSATVPVQVFVPVGTGGFYYPLLVPVKPIYPPAIDPTYTPPPSSVAG